MDSRGVYGVITTHYTNLKMYASGEDCGVVNGAMLFDTAAIAPLFQLDIGLPGSSFAFELARKMGLPEQLVKEAERRAGEEFVGIERNLRKIARNRRALDEKLQHIKHTDRTLETITDKYQKELEGIKQMRKDILDKAKKEAEEIVSGANKTVEKTIRTIRESQAEKEKTQDARRELQDFVTALQERKENEQKNRDDYIERKLGQLARRQKKNAARKGAPAATVQDNADSFRDGPLKVGEKVRVKDNGMVGEVVRVSARTVSVAIGNIYSQMPPSRLERISSNEFKTAAKEIAQPVYRRDDAAIRERKLNFKPELDVRGERVTDALDIVMHYIDDALMLGMGSVRIIHGKGTGALREEIQKYLRTVPGVASAKDEHIQLGGSGVTLVTFE
jgi:DNA mismatch repair protein MutS2